MKAALEEAAMKGDPSQIIIKSETAILVKMLCRRELQKFSNIIDKNHMTHPQTIETLAPKSTYVIPTYEVTNDGLQDAGTQAINFCKGSKDDENVPRQVGFFTESLLAVCVRYLQENNVGDLASRETSIAITNIEQALLWLGKRAADRAARGVQGTYQK